LPVLRQAIPIRYFKRSNTILRTLVLLFILTPFMVVGCGGIGHRAVLEDLRADPGHGALIEAVPFFPQPQGELMCGPAALASVMGYYGGADGSDGSDGIGAVAREVYNKRLSGTLPIDLFIYAKELGFGAEYYKGGLEDLKERLRARTPLILFLNLGIKAYPVGHYIVAVGYNDALQVVLAHSALEREKVYGYRRLLMAWSKTGFATLLITPRPHPEDGP
jgi:ABC-type bacteriocin/lantibiotic exporter with double-glycine peptidase domain